MEKCLIFTVKCSSQQELDGHRSRIATKRRKGPRLIVEENFAAAKANIWQVRLCRYALYFIRTEEGISKLEEELAKWFNNQQTAGCIPNLKVIEAEYERWYPNNPTEKRDLASALAD